jgi:hypothetical protein
MKSFSRFLLEAKETRASEQAKKLGLVGDGHGDWYSAQGEFVAKTIGGKLEFFNKGQRIGQRDIPPKQGAAKPQPTPGQIQPQAAQQLPRQQPGLKSAEDQPQDGDFLTVVFGKFNPPTKEHKKLFSEADRVAMGGEIRIYPSRSQDPKKNPLNPNRKIAYIKKMFPEVAEEIVNNPEMKSIFDVLLAANEDGYVNVNIVVGSDRQAEIQNLANKYNGKNYQFTEIRVVPTGNFDAEKDLSGISSGMLRKAAADNNFREFKRGMPKTMDENESKKLFNEVRTAMGFKQSMKENYKLWEIAPDLDFKNLRENYVQNKIFKNDDIVENMNTGLVGKVIRRGTNYLICVTEEDIMFKSWIKDLREYTEVKMDSSMRYSKHPNTLVGTTGAFKHYASLTPGAIKTNEKYLQIGGKAYGINFINKYKAKKASTC